MMNEERKIPSCENYENNIELELKERIISKSRNRKYHLFSLKRSLIINSVSYKEQANSYTIS